ncbi:25469_t:CDS:2, partial [Gigaspora rosea]
HNNHFQLPTFIDDFFYPTSSTTPLPSDSSLITNTNSPSTPAPSDPESSGSLQYETGSSDDPIVNKDPCNLTAQIIKDQVPTTENWKSPLVKQ